MQMVRLIASASLPSTLMTYEWQQPLRLLLCQCPKQCPQRLRH